MKNLVVAIVLVAASPAYAQMDAATAFATGFSTGYTAGYVCAKQGLSLNECKTLMAKQIEQLRDAELQEQQHGH